MIDRLAALRQFMAPRSFEAFIDRHSKISDWNSMDFVGFGPPKFHRMWVDHEDGFRVNLHETTSTGEKPVYHTHPWPSVMLILRGGYEMGLGTHGKEGARLYLPAGSYYELYQGDGWHWVEPPKPSLSLMLTWGDGELTGFKPLDEETQRHILTGFNDYGRKISQSWGTYKDTATT